MEFLHAILKGVLQGLTEFLPVSSTAHLIFFDTLAKLFGFETVSPNTTAEEFYDILLHLGTLAAVLVYFRAELWQVLQALFGKRSADEDEMLPMSQLRVSKLPFFIIGSMVITVGFILAMLEGSEEVMAASGWTTPSIRDISEFYLHHPQWVAVHLLITGCLLFFTEAYSSRHNPDQVKPFGWQNALIIGWAQGMAAIFHGLSRSGSTISAGLASGVDRLTATRYSFLLSIPTFLMAAVYEAMKLSKAGIADTLNWPAMLLGTVASGIVGYLCVKYFIQFVARHSLKGFAYYCWAAGASMFILLQLS
jgi:undecaprenyl-diphosphatase